VRERTTPRVSEERSVPLSNPLLKEERERGRRGEGGWDYLSLVRARGRVRETGNCRATTGLARKLRRNMTDAER
jgi:hypothetical protein